MSKPHINVTPLIDVLLVLLIIFMVVSPLKPHSFQARVPEEQKNNKDVQDPQTLVVSISPDLSLRLNQETGLGTVDESDPLIRRLNEVFRQRKENGVIDENTNNVIKTVFIKAPKTIGYGSVAKIIDAVKISGAQPIGLQIDDLD